MHDEDEFMMFGEDTMGRDRGFDIDKVYSNDPEDEFVDDERDFEDVDDLDELLAIDKEVEDIIHEKENIPEEDLRESVFEDGDEAAAEEEEEDDGELEHYDDDGELE